MLVSSLNSYARVYIGLNPSLCVGITRVEISKVESHGDSLNRRGKENRDPKPLKHVRSKNRSHTRKNYSILTG